MVWAYCSSGLPKSQLRRSGPIKNGRTFYKMSARRYMLRTTLYVTFNRVPTCKQQNVSIRWEAGSLYLYHKLVFINLINSITL